MILGCIADDFTGAGDIACTLAREGMRTALVTDLTAIEGNRAEACVIALKSRSIPVAEAVDGSLAALAALKRAGCRQIVFKYCSTFDSTPTGNIGPVAEALARTLDARAVVMCPAFPANGRTVYQGTLFVGDRPLAESGMRDHPITPMTDSDIRRWLQYQCQGEVSHVAHGVVRRGAEAIRASLDALRGLTIVDAISDDDLRAIGKAVRDDPLVTGGSAIALQLPQNFRDQGLLGEAEPLIVTGTGPALVLSGSCSIATNAQVARYRSGHPNQEVPVRRLLAGEPVVEELDAFARDNADKAPLVYSTASPEHIASDREAFDGPAAQAVEKLMGELAIRALARGVRRLLVAGGETSGAVVEALSPGQLLVGQELAPGVPALKCGDLALVLKSGNFGDEHFFAAALASISAER